MLTIALNLVLALPTFLEQEPKPDTPREQYEGLLRQYMVAEQAWTKRFENRGANAPNADAVARYREWPAWTFAPAFLFFAEENPDDPAATNALFWIVNLAPQVGVSDSLFVPLFRQALERLARTDRLKDPRIDEACRRALTYASPASERFLRLLLVKGPDRQTRGKACLALAKLLASRRKIARAPWFVGEPDSPFDTFLRTRLDPGIVKYIRETDLKATYEEADRLFEQAIREFGDLVDIKTEGKGGRVWTIAEVARSERDELRGENAEPSEPRSSH